MQARTLAVVTVLVDMKNAFLAQLEAKRKNPALLLMYTPLCIPLSTRLRSRLAQGTSLPPRWPLPCAMP